MSMITWHNLLLSEASSKFVRGDEVQTVKQDERVALPSETMKRLR